MTRTELRSAPKRIGGRESWRRAARGRTAYRRYVEERCQLVDAVFVGRFVTDPQESMALVARPRSKAVGARAGVQGSIDDEKASSSKRRGNFLRKGGR